jgi:AcrR family transcriptional regulator
LSKGGLLYHFASKDALIKGMLEASFTIFEKHIKEYLKTDSEPGAWLRGYIYATFPAYEGEADQYSTTASALIASAGINPDLLAPYAALLNKWNDDLSHSGINIEHAQMIRLAVDGLWLQEALGLTPLDKKQRNLILNKLVEETKI